MGALKDAKPSAGNRIPDKSRVTVFAKKAECKNSKSGNPMIEVDFEVAEGEHATKEWREWLATQDSGTWGYKSALVLRAAGLAHMIDAEVQAPDHEIAAALLGKYLIADVSMEVEKNKDGTEKTYQGTDGNVYPSTRNRGTAWYAHQTAPVQQAQPQRAAAPAPAPVQQAPVQQAPAPQYQQAPPQYAQQPVQQQQAPAPQYAPAPQQAPVQYAQPPAPQYAPQAPQGAPVPQQFAQPNGQAPAPWQVPPQAPPAAKKSKAKQG